MHSDAVRAAPGFSEWRAPKNSELLRATVRHSELLLKAARALSEWGAPTNSELLKANPSYSELLPMLLATPNCSELLRADFLGGRPGKPPTDDTPILEKPT